MVLCYEIDCFLALLCYSSPSVVQHLSCSRQHPLQLILNSLSKDSKNYVDDKGGFIQI